jgi:hypothetical protein
MAPDGIRVFQAAHATGCGELPPHAGRRTRAKGVAPSGRYTCARSLSDRYELPVVVRMVCAVCPRQDSAHDHSDVRPARCAGRRAGAHRTQARRDGRRAAGTAGVRARRRDPTCGPAACRRGGPEPDRGPGAFAARGAAAEWTRHSRRTGAPRGHRRASGPSRPSQAGVRPLSPAGPAGAGCSPVRPLGRIRAGADPDTRGPRRRQVPGKRVPGRRARKPRRSALP